jgi:ribosomal protein L37AE/L43A
MKKTKRCHACGTGAIHRVVNAQGVGVLTCDCCSEEWIDHATAVALDATSGQNAVLARVLEKKTDGGSMIVSITLTAEARSALVVTVPQPVTDKPKK